MSDMLSLGASGINAYQRALATVSNNIANVATDGYSRQTVSFQATQPKAYGTNYMGTGVSIEAITRQYDAFIESNLRGSLSDLKSQSPLVNYANRVVDLMAGESTSLSLSMGKFFSSARDLAAEPASLIARNVFLRSADSTASSFRVIAEQLNAIEAESRVGIGDIPKSVNTLAEQLSLVNKQLGRTPFLKNQPADLLDERDRLLRQMSEQVRINTEFASNGEVKVSLTDNFEQGVIVERDKAQTLGLEVGGDNRVTMVLNPYSPDKRETLGSLGGGTLGGLLAFREQVLRPMQEHLNLLAKTFMNEVNAIHRQGVDAMGRPGEDLFTLSPSGGSVAESIGVNVVDPQRVAAASAFRVVAEPLNQGGSLARVAYTEPAAAPVPVLEQVVTGINTHPDASVPVDVQTITPLATVPAGSKNTVIYLDPDGNQWLQVMTRDGRHLMGKALDGTEQALVFDPNAKNGLASGAGYSTTYLNQPAGALSYLGMSYFMGARAQSVAVAEFDPQSHLEIGTRQSSARLTSERLSDSLDPLGNGPLTLNGVAVPSSVRNVNDFIDWVNSAPVAGQEARMGLSAKLVNSVAIPTKAIRLASDSVLILNGQQVDLADVSSLSGLAQAISNQMGPNLQASLGGSGELVLSTLDGSAIEIGGGNDPKLFALPEGTFAGRLQIDASPNYQVDALPANMGGQSLAINGTAINLSGVSTLSELSQAILSKFDSLGVRNIQATVSSSGQLILGTLDGSELNISGTLLTAANLHRTDKIELGLGSGGSPAELEKLGFRTAAYLDGVMPEDLLVFVAGVGTAKVSASSTPTEFDTQTALRESPLTIQFGANNRYTIKDNATGTLLAERTYDPASRTINYRGLTFTFNSVVEPGDKFYFDDNRNGNGDNTNVLRMSELQDQAVIGSYTLNEAYVDFVQRAGNVAQQASVAEKTLGVVHDQAVQTRESAVGVNLDEEAADLIRFQQAYQANAKIIQVAGSVFDTLLNSLR